MFFSITNPQNIATEDLATSSSHHDDDEEEDDDDDEEEEDDDDDDVPVQELLWGVSPRLHPWAFNNGEAARGGIGDHLTALLLH